MKIYVKFGKAHVGPLSPQEVADKVVSGEIPLSAKMFSKELGGKWMKLKGHPALPFPEGHSAGNRKSRNVILLIVLLLLCGSAARTVTYLMREKSSDKALASVAKRMESAVGLVVAERREDTGWVRHSFATAWAWKKDIFLTNAHVVEGAEHYMKNGFRIYVVLNQSPSERFYVTGLSKHPHYRPDSVSSNGKEVPFSYDVGALQIEGPLPTRFKLADKSTLHSLKAGERVAYLGFPMENLVNNGVDVDSPIANMQSGIITAVSDFDQGDSGPKNNLLIRHNMGCTGGASGSPIFNRDGDVVAILNAGNMMGQMVGVDEAGEPIVARAPSAVMINFAQRVDLIFDLPQPRRLNRE